MPINNSIINQKGTPAFYSDIFANRPTYGYAGRIFISTDTGAIYEDTGTSWTLIADAGAGTTPTLQQVTTAGNTTTLGVTIQGIDINDGAGTGASNMAIGTNALSSNTTGTGNTAIGYVSLNSNTTGGGNVGVGFDALQFNTTGGDNTGIGTYSLKANTTGNFNTALGSGSLQSNTTASANTGIGTNSLNSNTTGANNTAIGYASMTQNTTASDNTAIGYSSLNLNTTGTQNTAVGKNSLNNNLTGNYNVGIGYNSLVTNSAGSYNTAIGTLSLSTNAGASNTAIGYGTGSAITTGSANTIIGYNSLPNVTTGQQNTIIGASSGGGITTGSNNTIIGVGVNSLSTTLANNIILADGSGNVRLFSDANGLIAINQAVGSVPGGQLDIHTVQTYALVLNGLTTSNAYTAFSSNSVGKWRIGNTYNAGANTFDIYNLGTSANALSFNATTSNATFTGSVTASSLIKSGGTSAQILAGDGSVITAGTNITISGGTISSSGGGSMAIGGTITSATAGSILFVGTGGVLAQNNANFNWDNTNGRLQIPNFSTTNSQIKTGSLEIQSFSLNNGWIGENMYYNGSNFTFRSTGKATLFYFYGGEGQFRCFPSQTAGTQPTGNFTRLKFDELGNFGAGGTIDGALGGYTGSKLYINTSGNCGINTITIGSQFQVNGGTAIGYSASTAAPTNGLIVAGGITAAVGLNITGNGGFFNQANKFGIDENSGAARFYSNGPDVSTKGSYELHISNSSGSLDVTAFAIANTGAAKFSDLAGTGSRTVLADSVGTLSAPVSDISVKENIQTIGYGLSEILKMNPVWFDYIDEYKNYGETRQNGNIAQEMELIIPEAVFTTPSTGKMGINYDQLHAVYIKAIQELKAEINALKNN